MGGEKEEKKKKEAQKKDRETSRMTTEGEAKVADCWLGWQAGSAGKLAEAFWSQKVGLVWMDGAAVGQRKSRSTAREGVIGGGQMSDMLGCRGGKWKWKNENRKEIRGKRRS